MYNVYMYMYVHRIAGIFSREKSYANWWNNGISWRKQERKHCSLSHSPLMLSGFPEVCSHTYMCGYKLQGILITDNVPTGTYMVYIAIVLLHTSLEDYLVMQSS